MKYSRLEIIMAYLVSFGCWVRRRYFEFFPGVALAFAVFYGYALGGGIEQGTITCEDIPTIVIIALTFTINVLIYIALVLYDRNHKNRH